MSKALLIAFLVLTGCTAGMGKLYQDDPGLFSLDKPTYDVWCDPKSDLCDYYDQEVTRTWLVANMPQVKTKWCDELFCYNENYNAVVGINPDSMYKLIKE